MQQPPADFKAPPPRKAETPPTSEVLVIGDSLADWLAYGLEEVLADTPEIGFVRKIKPYSGLVRYQAHNDALDWPQALKDTLATEKPKVIVVMLGLNDREPLRERIGQAPQKSITGQNEPATAPSNAEPGQQGSGPAHSAATAPPAAAPAASDASRQVQTVSYDFHTDKWADAYGKRIDAMIAALKTNGVPVLWIGLPAIRGTRTIGDISYLNELYRKRAEKAGIIYADIWDGFVDDQGQYTVQGPDFEGQIRRLRSSDGVHFTKYGAAKLAHYIEHDVRRALKRGIPVAVSGPQEPNAEGAGARTAIGPVVPLNDNAVEGGELLGVHNGPAPPSSDSIAMRVLSRGDAISAPAGRADNFSWPRADANAPIPTTVEVVSVAPVSSILASPRTSAAKAADGENAARAAVTVVATAAATLRAVMTAGIMAMRAVNSAAAVERTGLQVPTNLEVEAAQTVMRSVTGQHGTTGLAAELAGRLGRWLGRLGRTGVLAVSSGRRSLLRAVAVCPLLPILVLRHFPGLLLWRLCARLRLQSWIRLRPWPPVRHLRLQ